MNWPVLIDFVESAAPSFLASVEGVAPEDVELVQSTCGVSLPRDYVRFLTLMGLDSGDFHPFGATQVHDFAELAEELPTQDYPESDYFKIAFESDSSEITPYDTFLDLHRRNGDDAALVMIESGIQFSPKAVIDLAFTFGETLTRQAYRFFELDRRRHMETVYVTNLSNTEVLQRKRAAVGLLREMGFAPVLEAFAHVECLTRGTCSALVGAHEVTSLLNVTLSCDDRMRLDVVVDQLLTTLPGAET